MARRIGFFGSPLIAAELLSALHSDGHRILFVVSNPDRRLGRHSSLQPTEVSRRAETLGLTLYRPERVKEMVGTLQQHDAEVYLVFAYGQIIPRSVFAFPPHGTLNLHASLLPAWRGASPIRASILAGDPVTGWSVQQITEKLDAGPVLSQVEMAIQPTEDAAELTERMLPAGIALVRDTLADLEGSLARATEQDHSRATYCQKIRMEDAELRWSHPAVKLDRMIRAYAGWPVAHTTFRGGKLKIHKARLDDSSMPGDPGQLSVQKGRLFVASGQGVLEILSLQPENKNRLPAAAFVNGYRPHSSECFGGGGEDHGDS